MGQNSKIEWTDDTWSPWHGCTKVSEGCKNCYAEKQARRNPGTLGIWGPTGTRVVTAEASWRQPLKWNRDAAKDGVRKRVFCASIADVFEEWDGPVASHTGARYWAAAEQATGFDAALDAVQDETKRRILRLLADAGRPLSREELAEQQGLHPNGGR